MSKLDTGRRRLVLGQNGGRKTGRREKDGGETLKAVILEGLPEELLWTQSPG